MLLALTLCFWTAAAVAHLVPDTPVGRACRTWAVQRPAAWLARLTPARIGAALMFVLALFVLAPVVPIEAIFLAAGDLTVYLEVLAAVTLMALRGRSLRAHLRTFVARRFRAVARSVGSVLTRGRERRRRERRPPQTPSGEDERPAAWTPAFA